MGIDPNRVTVTGEPLFARGFILSEKAEACPVPGWLPLEAGPLRGWRDPRLPVGRADEGGRWCLVLDTAVDTESPLATTDDMAGAILRGGIRATDSWSGRFAVLFGDSAQANLALDASGSRAVFYSTAGPFVLASHAYLVRLAIGAPVDTDFLNRMRGAGSFGGAKYFPGARTPFVNVEFAPANHILTMDRRLVRFWPVRPLEALTTDEAALILKRGLKAGLEGHLARQPVILSLTAGLDSRTSLAAVREYWDRLSFFTHVLDSNPNHSIDGRQAAAIAETCGLNHAVLHVSSSQDLRAYFATVSRNTFLGHGQRTAYRHWQAFAEGSLHLSSNHAEAGRAYFRAHGVTGDLTPTLMADIWRKQGGDAGFVQIFADWSERVGLLSVPVDPMDMFYIEHRMVVWVSCNFLECDVAGAAATLFNSRNLLAAMLSVPLGDRIAGSVMRRIIDDGAPELAEHKINPLRSWQRRKLAVRARTTEPAQ